MSKPIKIKVLQGYGLYGRDGSDYTFETSTTSENHLVRHCLSSMYSGHVPDQPCITEDGFPIARLLCRAHNIELEIVDIREEKSDG
jgi:hypothetical protein